MKFSLTFLLILISVICLFLGLTRQFGLHGPIIGFELLIVFRLVARVLKIENIGHIRVERISLIEVFTLLGACGILHVLFAGSMR